MYYRPPCINLRNNTLFSFLITCHIEITGILNCEDGVVYALVGNGFCNDETNNAACNFDGDDCCGANVNQDHCSECECIGCQYKSLVANGICEDENNNDICSFDGGDCCLSKTAKVGIAVDPFGHCSKCECSPTGVITSPRIKQISSSNFKIDGFDPRDYDNHLDVFWLIEVASVKLIEINFVSFDVNKDLQSNNSHCYR